jgi:hypothetical protein
MDEYTVVGFWTNNDQPLVEWVEDAGSVDEAIELAVKQARERDESEASITIVEVFGGHHRGLTRDDYIQEV